MFCCGAALCALGAATLLPVLAQSGDAVCENGFSIRIAWPGLLLIPILLAYARNVGVAFMRK